MMFRRTGPDNAKDSQMDLKPIIVLLLTSVALSAQAGSVYRCQGPHGTVFSDAPCGSNQQRVEVEESYSSGPPGLRESEIRALERIDQERTYRSRITDYRRDGDRIDQRVEERDRREACYQLDRQRAWHTIGNGDYVTRRRQLGCP